MWTREYIKTAAKEVLKFTYPKAFLVSMILIIVGGDSGIGINYRYSNGDSANWTNYLNHWIPTSVLVLYATIIIITIIISFALYRILVGYPMEVGGRRFFKQAAQMDINMGYLGYGFKRGVYLDIVKTMLYRSVLNSLWYLLLVIPGVIKSYAYSMVPYILADNPNIGYSRAVELSNQMTDGQKFNMWVLDLSFIGWYLLGLLLFFVGALLVKPYENATKAELYLVLRQNALECEYCSYDELLMESPV